MTVTDCRRSPSSGCFQTISWVPIGTDTFAIGVVPRARPSSQTSAHGTALIDSDPFGSVTDVLTVLPAGIVTLDSVRKSSAGLTNSK